MANTVIGASIFGLPSLIAARLGSLSPLAYPAAGLGVIVIALCLSEVASQFAEAGGPYLYARETLGRFAGFVVAWMTWLSRIAASSAAAKLFATYLVVMVPSASQPAVRRTPLVVPIGFLAAVNVRGVSAGTRLSNVFTATKVGLLVFFAGSGLLMMALRPEVRVVPPRIPTHAADWFEAALLLVYAYGGFEAALIVAGEARDPRRDAPFALLTALTVIAALYTSVQYVVIHTLPDAARSERPGSDAALHFLGPWAAAFVAAGTLVALYGYLSANMVHAPRITYALAERGDFPRIFGAVHARFRTPHVSIMAFSALLLGLTFAGNFRWNATLSVFARLFSYATVAIAVPVLRRKHPDAKAFRLPAAPVFVGTALVFCGALMSRVRRGDVVVLGITAAVALANWFWARGRRG